MGKRPTIVALAGLLLCVAALVMFASIDEVRRSLPHCTSLIHALLGRWTLGTTTLAWVSAPHFLRVGAAIEPCAPRSSGSRGSRRSGSRKQRNQQ